MAARSMHVPQPRQRNPCQVSHVNGLASSAFARHYSRNHNCFLFLRVLRCFTSPRYPPHPIDSDTGNTTSLVLGFPIRTSSDPRSVGSSPRHIAASNVLHRPLMPRHPPCALKHLQQKQKNQKTIQRKLHHTQLTPHPTRQAHPHEESGPTRMTPC